MKIQCYFRALGDEATLKLLNSHLADKNSTLKHLTNVIREYSVTGESKPWLWKGGKRNISIEHMDSDFLDIIETFSSKYLSFESNEREKIYLFFQIVLPYEEGSDPIGLSFSRSIVGALSSINASIDIDPSKI